MTVKELYDKLGVEIQQGHGDLKVIANCRFKLFDGRMWVHFSDFYLTELDDVYYQSGDIELGFSQKE